MKLTTAIEYLGGTAPHLDPALSEREVTSFVIDSREVLGGDVFFALSQPEYRNSGFNGDFDDSTVFVPAAFEAGAAACVIRRDRYEEHREQLELFRDRLIFVDDCIAALQHLAHRLYEDWGGRVVAITGSAGKTTAKELTANVVEASGLRVLRSMKNYNNGLGLPLTVVRLAADPGFDIAVLEMGMSTPFHEIARLCTITPPDVAVELNVLPVHVEHLGSIENVAAAKAELVEGMREGGVAILNADDPRVSAMAALSRGDVITYGIDNRADVMAGSIDSAGFGRTTFELVTPSGSSMVRFPLNGRHNILNALAASAVGHHLGMSADAIASALARSTRLPQRGEIVRFADGFTVINDSYNSNPDALLSMVRTLVDGAGGDERRVVVAGEMLELGDRAAEMHFETGEAIARSGVDLLIGVRGLGRHIVDGAASAGMMDVHYVEDSVAAGELLASLVRSGDVVLIKGSRGVRTERVLDSLVEKFEQEVDDAVAA